MGSFIPSKAPIYNILNFVGRGKCSTSAMNGDSVCCTRASMSIHGYPRTVAPKIVPPSLADVGLDLHLHRPCQAFLRCNRLRGVRRDHAPWSSYFLLIRQRLGGRRGVVAPPVVWYCGLHGLVVHPVVVAPV